MKKFFIKKIVFISLLFSFLILSACDKHSDLENIQFTNYIDAYDLRIFAKEDVSSDFLNNVGKAYEEMFADNPMINQDMRSKYLSTSKNKYVYQRVGVEASFENNENYAGGSPPAPYQDNVTDYIWEMQEGGKSQIGEVIEHLLHTITNVILYLAYIEDWDYMNSTSALSLATQEAIDQGIYDISSYEEIKKEDIEMYYKVITQEYAYWLILAEWDYYITAGKKREDISGNEEFIIGTPTEIESQLPLGHKLYKDYVEKILSIPDKATITSLFK